MMKAFDAFQWNIFILFTFRTRFIIAIVSYQHKGYAASFVFY